MTRGIDVNGRAASVGGRAVPIGPTAELPDSVVARYPLEGDTSTAEDTIGSYNATISGATRTSDAQQGNYARSFDGTDDYIQSPYNTDGTQSFSWSVWANPSSASGVQMIIDQRDDDYRGWHFAVESGKFRFFRTNASNVVDITTSATAGDWAHLILVSDQEAGEMRLYKNGTVANTVSNSGTHPGDDSILFGNQLGGSSGVDGSNPYGGILDDPMIADGALTDQDVSDIYGMY